MANIIDYVNNTQVSFAEQPLNRVDSLVFSWLAYMRIPEEIEAACTPEGVSIASIGLSSGQTLLGLTAPVYDTAATEELLKACATSARFADVTVCHAVDTWSRHTEVQFSAVTFLLPGAPDAPSSEPLGAYVAFRGTDDTLVGWKENFNMAFQTIPAQTAATEYIDNIARSVTAPLWLGGHSKGGNLAVYALNTCSAATRQRIKKCFAHDAPGFTDETRAAAQWAHADEMVDKTIPEESIVGLLFDKQTRDVTVVKSTNPGILQHSPFSWVIQDNDFVGAHAVSYDSYRTNKRLNAWLETMDTPSRERFVEVLYKLVNATGEVTLSAVTGSLKDGSLDLALQRLDGLPEDDRTFFLTALEDLAATILLGPAPTNPQTPVERAKDAEDKIEDLTARFDDHMSKLDKYLGL